MSGSTSKAERREFRKTLGETAAEMLGDVRMKQQTQQLEIVATAKELAALLDGLPRDVSKLHARIDGVAAWCEQNERNVAQTDRNVVALGGDLEREHRRLVRLSDDVRDFFQMTRWQRLKWALFGTLPARSIPADPTWTMDAQEAMMRDTVPAIQPGQGETAATEHGGR